MFVIVKKNLFRKFIFYVYSYFHLVLKLEEKHKNCIFPPFLKYQIFLYLFGRLGRITRCHSFLKKKYYFTAYYNIFSFRLTSAKIKKIKLFYLSHLFYKTSKKLKLKKKEKTSFLVFLSFISPFLFYLIIIFLIVSYPLRVESKDMVLIFLHI